MLALRTRSIRCLCLAMYDCAEFALCWLRALAGSRAECPTDPGAWLVRPETGALVRPAPPAPPDGVLVDALPYLWLGCVRACV